MPQVGVTVECEGGKVELLNFVQPTLYHFIRVHTKGESRVEKVYTFADANVDGSIKGEEWWTTYRYQLEAFVDRLKGRTPQTWVEAQDSVANMEWIERIYAKVRGMLCVDFTSLIVRPRLQTGLGSRPKSSYNPSSG